MFDAPYPASKVTVVIVWKNQVDGHYSREKTYLFDIVERPKGRNAGKYCALNIKLIE